MNLLRKPIITTASTIHSAFGSPYTSISSVFSATVSSHGTSRQRPRDRDRRELTAVKRIAVREERGGHLLRRGPTPHRERAAVGRAVRTTSRTTRHVHRQPDDLGRRSPDAQHRDGQVEQVRDHHVVRPERGRPDLEVPVAVRHDPEQLVHEPEQAGGSADAARSSRPSTRAAPMPASPGRRSPWAQSPTATQQQMMAVRSRQVSVARCRLGDVLVDPAARASPLAVRTHGRLQAATRPRRPGGRSTRCRRC